MKHLRIALILGCMPASPVLADSLEREEALKLPQTLITGNRQVEARSDSSSAAAYSPAMISTVCNPPA